MDRLHDLNKAKLINHFAVLSGLCVIYEILTHSEVIKMVFSYCL